SNGRDTTVECVEGIGHLPAGDVQGHAWIAVEPASANVAHHADDLTRSFSSQLPHGSFSEQDLVAQRIGLGPVLFRHSLIDDDNRVRAAVVAFVEGAAAHHGYTENLEV